VLRIQRSRTPGPGPAGVTAICSEHFSEDLLWKVVKQGRSLEERYLQHAKECRDCREFVSEFSIEARGSGFSFPDLLPHSDERQAN